MWGWDECYRVRQCPSLLPDWKLWDKGGRNFGPFSSLPLVCNGGCHLAGRWPFLQPLQNGSLRVCRPKVLRWAGDFVFFSKFHGSGSCSLWVSFWKDVCVWGTLLPVGNSIATAQPAHCSVTEGVTGHWWVLVGGNNLIVGVFNWCKTEGQLEEVFAVENQQHLFPFAGASEKRLRPFTKGTGLSHRHSGSEIIELLQSNLITGLKFNITGNWVLCGFLAAGSHCSSAGFSQGH